MLESMITNPRPTRAECSDVANAVLDGTDCVMLSGETANGPYFEQAVSVMARTCCEAESSRNYDSLYQAIRNSVSKRYNISAGESLASSAVKTSIDINAKFLVVLSETGTTARQVAKFSPGRFVICLTPRETIARQCSGIYKGVHAYTVDSLENTEEILQMVSHEAIKAGMAQAGDKMVVVCGNTYGTGANDQIKVEVVTDSPALPNDGAPVGSLKKGFSFAGL